CQLMVNHLNLNNDKDFSFLLIKSIKNGSITVSSLRPIIKVLKRNLNIKIKCLMMAVKYFWKKE
ncbi:hypothetical protein, partial [Acinetobacter bereziniae]|uniref:hypothetical protein n=1 Tax=Acinetobacter bereziniae TaxID=106648 RepID=UPI0032B386B2